MTMSRDRHYRQRHPGSLRRGSAYAGSSWLVTVVVTLCAACGEDPPPPPQAGQAKAAAAAENPGKPTDPQAGPASANAAQETPGGDAGQAAAGDTTGAEPPAAPKDTGNAWQLPSRPADVNNGDRVYVLTRGRDRTYTDPAAVYQLYAYDVAAVHGEKVTLQELGGGRFTVSGLFVIPSGAKLKSLRKGDMVLAEWASSLKHAIITGLDGDKVTVRYTDLPES